MSKQQSQRHVPKSEEEETHGIKKQDLSRRCLCDDVQQHHFIDVYGGKDGDVIYQELSSKSTIPATPISLELFDGGAKLSFDHSIKEVKNFKDLTFGRENISTQI